MRRTLLGIVFVTAIGACSGGNGVSQSTADAWPAKWCQARPGITKEQLVTIMGQPTGGSATQMTWAAHQYQFNAFLETDGTVRQLDINQHSLSDAEKAALACNDVRTNESAARTTPARATACALVSEAQMSAILGAAVVAAPDGNNKCNYKPTASITPFVELSIDWGNGAAAMQALGIAAQPEPGTANPFDGIGDQTAAIGPAVMIRNGEDLVTMVFSGVDDMPSAARRIFDTAEAGM